MRLLVVLAHLRIGLFLLPSLTSSSAHAQGLPENTARAPTSDYVVEGAGRSRLELVREEGADGPEGLEVLTSEGALGCRLPCELDVPFGMVRLVAPGLRQQFDLRLPVATFRVRAGAPTPWLEALGAIVGGLAAGGGGGAVVINHGSDDQLGYGVALLVVGALLLGVGIAALVRGLLEENGSAELDTVGVALREGVLRF
jgi:hypothetical protein